jgi:hypothetical protein
MEYVVILMSAKSAIIMNVYMDAKMMSNAATAVAVQIIISVVIICVAHLGRFVLKY